MASRTGRLMIWLALAALLSAILAACEGNVAVSDRQLAPISLAAGQKLSVVATTNIVGDVVKNVGGELISLTTLMGVGVDPHTYVPTPADTAAIHDAHLVVANGAGLEANLEEILQATGGGALAIHLSDGLDLLAETGHGDAGQPEGDQGDHDPHVWFSVPNVISWAGVVQRTLSTLDPGNAGVYQANAAAYIGQLEDLDAWVKQQVAQIPEGRRALVTNHPAFGYFAARYGLEQVGAVYPISPASEPSAQDIAALQDTIRRHSVSALFVESTVSPKLAEQVAADTGVRIVALYTGSLGASDSGAATYIELIRFDTEAIVQALK